MFCGKCGNNVPDGVPFCGNCGAPMGNNPNPVFAQQPMVGSTKPTGLGGVTGNKSLLYYIGIFVCQIFILLGWFGEGVTAKATFFGETLKENGAICDIMEDADLGFFNVLIVIGCLAAIAPVVLTLITKAEKMTLAPVLYVGLVLILVCFVVVFIAMADANDSLGGFAKVGFNFLGILALLGVAGTAVLPILAKKAK